MTVSAIQSDEALPDRRPTLFTAPKQIRFVSNDVCATCSDNGHNCLGYAEAPNHQKRDSESSTSSRNDDSNTKPTSRPPSVSPQPPMRMSPQTYDRPPLPQHLSTDSAQSGYSSQSSALRQRPDSEPRSPASGSLSNGPARNRVPFFRYFGPTAIVPGFKQMVVQMRGGHRSSAGYCPGSPVSTNGTIKNNMGATPSISGNDARPPVEMPFYDPSSPLPVSPLITLLCQTFFTHLGCNYPFLQRERFLHDLEEKRVDTILVDAVCALAARFSNHPLLCVADEHSIEIDANNETARAFRGNAFTQRAMATVIDVFPCPTIAAVQACLLLAYGEFGLNRDSGLWQWLGLAIRMAQDLGMQKLEGLRLEGRVGPTPKTIKNGAGGKAEQRQREKFQQQLLNTDLRRRSNSVSLEPVSIEDRRASERERVDTFYAVFFLDRCVSSGTGRPVSLRDKEIEISFPFRPETETVDGWPHPFPPLIRIVHLYGRIADVLNGIKDFSYVTDATMNKLGGMEKDLTGIYQKLSPKLHFNAVNFQHYVKHEQGTNFILLHFWFHTLICLVHQPTLLHSFEGRIQQLFPDSRELSMSSAKTIADILAFAELIDVKSFIGNPFTSQPMYIAACAFLAEAAAQSPTTPSRAPTPITPSKKLDDPFSDLAKMANMDPNLNSKHTLLASAANQNYQRCYKALKALEQHWAGTRYIVNVLDQKAKGIMDPVLYTSEDIDSAIEMPRQEPDYTSPGWRRSLPYSSIVGPHLFKRSDSTQSDSQQQEWSPKVNRSQAIGWSLTGTTHSPNPNLSFLYQTTNGDVPNSITSFPNAHPHPERAPSFNIDPSLSGAHIPEGTRAQSQTPQPPSRHNTMPSSNPHPPLPDLRPHLSTSSAMPPPRNPLSASPSPHPQSSSDDFLGLPSPFSNPTSHLSPSTICAPAPFTSPHAPTSNPYTVPAAALPPPPPPGLMEHQQQHTPPMSDMMMIESQDVDFTNHPGTLGGFPGPDMIPWLEYLPPDVLNYFGDTAGGHGMEPGPPGPHPAFPLRLILRFAGDRHYEPSTFERRTRPNLIPVTQYTEKDVITIRRSASHGSPSCTFGTPLEDFSNFSKFSRIFSPSRSTGALFSPPRGEEGKQTCYERHRLCRSFLVSWEDARTLTETPLGSYFKLFIHRGADQAKRLGKQGKDAESRFLR
ncbi:MAG: hypothetical protein Q9227_007366 [Pyrenula ochraceoflavens]